MKLGYVSRHATLALQIEIIVDIKVDCKNRVCLVSAEGHSVFLGV